MAMAFPEAVIDGAVSRDVLKAIIARDATALRRIEQIVHPLVGQDRARFIEAAAADIIVLDIPLLFETGGEARVDATVCVTVDADTQKARVLARGTMTEEQFATILAKQMPDADKRARADYVIVTDTLEHGAQQVRDVLADIRKRMTDA
jgi:dephospho-CoA kinase